MSQDILQRIKNRKEKHHEKVGANLRERIKYESRDTLSFIERQQSKGKSTKEIVQDLEKSRYKNS